MLHLAPPNRLDLPNKLGLGNHEFSQLEIKYFFGTRQAGAHLTGQARVPLAVGAFISIFQYPEADCGAAIEI